MMKKAPRSFSGVKKYFKRYTTPFLAKYEEFVIKKYLKGKRLVLDACCGGGRASVPLSNMSFRVIGIDIDKKFINFAKRHFASKNLKFYVGDIRSFKYIEKFDACVFFENSLEHVEGSLIRTLINISRNCKKNSILIITMHSMFFPLTFLYLVLYDLSNLFRNPMIFENAYGIKFRIYSPFHIIAILRKLGFELLDVYNIKNDKPRKLPFVIKWFGWYLVLIFKKIR